LLFSAEQLTKDHRWRKWTHFQRCWSIKKKSRQFNSKKNSIITN